ncbi:unnamed protein product [Penicillium pancosmium]
MEKLPVHTNEDLAGPQPRWATAEQRQNRPPRNTLLRRIFIALVFFAGFYMFVTKGSEFRLPAPCHASGSSKQTIMDHKEQAHALNSNMHASESHKIPLEAHIMSKCPDAQECLKELILPTMEQVSDKVDFQLSFIANWNPASEEIECKHGPTECIGNMLILCAANLPFPPTSDESLLPAMYPRTPVIRSLGFANCLIDDFPRIPERDFVHQCALEHGIDFDALNRCASQQDDTPGESLSGIALLRQNVQRSKELGVTTSCTVRLDDKVWCIKDDGEWKDCVQNGEGGKPQVLVDEINKLYKEKN